MRDGPNSAVTETLDQNFYRKQGRSELADAGDLALVDILRRDQFGLLKFVSQRLNVSLSPSTAFSPRSSISRTSSSSFRFVSVLVRNSVWRPYVSRIGL